MSNPLVLLLVALLAIGGGAMVWSERGLWQRLRRTRQRNERVLIEDALKEVYEGEVKGFRPTPAHVAGALSISVTEASDLLSKMEARNLIRRQECDVRLTPSGREYALRVIRTHRLWERYLAEETGFDVAEWHGLAHDYEHQLSPEEVEALAARLGHPTHDPHGDPIPTAEGEMVPHGGQPLTTLDVDERARIVHLEDEPAAVYAQLVAEGLAVGTKVRLIERSPQRIRFWSEGDEHVLAPIMAENISVVPLPKEALVEMEPCENMARLKPGQKARVVGISRVSRGPERRRLMDLGLLPGTIVEAEMTSPGGDPTAYRIRGALIGLRREQARLVNVNCLEEEANEPAEPAKATEEAVV